MLFTVKKCEESSKFWHSQDFSYLNYIIFTDNYEKYQLMKYHNKYQH